MRLLLISSSRTAGYDFLEYPKPYINDFMGSESLKIAFVPFAAVGFSDEESTGYDAYEKRVQTVFEKEGYHIESIHRQPQAIETADAIFVGGGNTFQLLKVLQEKSLMAPIRERVMKHDIPYVGWSAGANLACPTIRTTNDMPITRPHSFTAFGFVPFQINPHYIDGPPHGHCGETREERIMEFLALNREVRVVGLREGTILRIENDKIEYKSVGADTCRFFEYGRTPRELGSSDMFALL